MAATETRVIGSGELFAQFRRDASARGLLAPAGRAHLARCVVLGPALVALLILAWTTNDTTSLLLAAALSGVVSVQIGFTAHDAGHGSVSQNRFLNSLAGNFAFTLVNGLGFQSWRTSHDDHHRFCQDESRDPDMQVDTLMSLTPGSAAKKAGIGRLLLPYQGYILWPLSTLFAHSLRLQSLARTYSQPARFRLDAGLLPLHYLLWWAAPWWLLGVSPGRVLAVYLLASTIMGSYLALLFWVNHIGMPVLQNGHGLSTLEQQVVTSRNLRAPRVFDFVFGGLNLQIEHHLLPGCPSTRLRGAQELTRPLCAACSLPYQEESLLAAIAAVTAHVVQIGATAGRRPKARLW